MNCVANIPPRSGSENSSEYFTLEVVKAVGKAISSHSYVKILVGRLGVGCRGLGVGYWALGARCWVLGVGYRGCLLLTSDSSECGIVHMQSFSLFRGKVVLRGIFSGKCAIGKNKRRRKLMFFQLR